MKTRVVTILILGALAAFGVAYGTPPGHPHKELFHHEPIEPPVDPKPEPVSPYQLRDKARVSTGDTVRD
jgi:hypothetical protein